MKKASYHNKKAFSLVEVLLAIGLFSFIVLAFAGALAFSIQGNADASQTTKATYLAMEGIEASKLIRGEDFSNLIDGSYGLSSVSNVWSFSGSNDITDEYTRQITISSISSLIKQVDSTVTWNSLSGRTNTITFSTYLTDWQYEVEPPEPSPGWTQPIVVNTVNATGNQDAQDIFVVGTNAYIVRTSGTNLLVYDLSNVNSPSLLGSTNAGSGGLYRIVVNGNYAYVASDSNSEEVQIFNISNPASLLKVATVNLSGNNNATSLTIQGNYLYVVRNGGNADFAIVDITNPLSPSVSGYANINNGTDVKVNGNYAYVASDSNNQELQVVNVTSKSSPSGLGSLNIGGNNDAESIVFYNDRVIIGTTDGEVHIINVSTPATPSLVSTTAIGTSNIRDMELGYTNSYLFTVGDSAASEFIVANISNENSVIVLGIVDETSGLNGISYNSVNDIAYVASDEDSQEIIIYGPTN
ncbi:hypothetical protein KC669_04405 [Candidatus Dojkabacteria bacterium]|uniref:Prepilin-type N-terminal cleavage/methylation domain-containing protein n=1 Tax=Candidatus Dojkabacteria bacterium TaxID=2099670 RepID=A0A955LBK4_9BACT|nr:hypothetical protein [Candidatus Dojkabacteria bacterium]